MVKSVIGGAQLTFTKVQCFSVVDGKLIYIWVIFTNYLLRMKDLVV